MSERPVIDSATRDAAAALAVLELHVTANAIAHVPLSVLHGKEHGITSATIEAPDLKLAYRVAEHFGDEGPIKTAGWVKLAMIKFGYWEDGERAGVPGLAPGWGPWDDGKLLRFVMAYHGEPATRRLCRGLRQFRDTLTAVTYEATMMYTPPPPLGEVLPLRIPLELIRLSRATAIPLPHLHQLFQKICSRQDLRKKVFPCPTPRGATHASSPLRAVPHRQLRRPDRPVRA